MQKSLTDCLALCCGANSGTGSPKTVPDLSGARAQAEFWLNRVELLLSLFTDYCMDKYQVEI
jgi:hypothetical protein